MARAISNLLFNFSFNICIGANGTIATRTLIGRGLFLLLLLLEALPLNENVDDDEDEDVLSPDETEESSLSCMDK